MPMCLTGAQLDTIKLRFQAMEGIVADFAARPHLQNRAPRRLDCAQAQPVSSVFGTLRNAVTIRLRKRRLQFEAKCCGMR